MVRATKTEPPDDYVQVEWGQDLALHHAMAQAGRPDSSLVVDLGPLGLGYAWRRAARAIPARHVSNERTAALMADCP